MHPFLRICTYMFSINLKPKGLENSTCDLPSKSIPFAVVPIIINCPITHLENCNIYYFPFSLQNCRFISTSNVPSPYIMHVSYHKYGLSGLSPLTLPLSTPFYSLSEGLLNREVWPFHIPAQNPESFLTAQSMYNWSLPFISCFWYISLSLSLSQPLSRVSCISLNTGHSPWGPTIIHSFLLQPSLHLISAHFTSDPSENVSLVSLRLSSSPPNSLLLII